MLSLSQPNFAIFGA